jgi:3-methyladenine DNA glycosylase AlkD
MFDQVNHIESYIAYYEAKIKSDKESIKNYKKFIKERNASDWFITHFQGSISHYKDLIKNYEASLKYNEARLAKFKIEKFAASGIKFRVIQGGIS